VGVGGVCCYSCVILWGLLNTILLTKQPRAGRSGSLVFAPMTDHRVQRFQFAGGPLGELKTKGV
jgi:hypothetical protein